MLVDALVADGQEGKKGRESRAARAAGRGCSTGARSASWRIDSGTGRTGRGGEACPTTAVAGERTDARGEPARGDARRDQLAVLRRGERAADDDEDEDRSAA